MDFEIHTNALETRHFFNRLAKQQLPFAISRATNRLAWDLRDTERDDLDKYFTIRTDWLKQHGSMPVVRSHKDQTTIHAILGVADKVAALNATGGTKEAKNDFMAVPFSNAGRGLSTRSILNPARETLGQATWPKNIVRENTRLKTKQNPLFGMKDHARRGRGDAKPFYMTSKKSGRRFVAMRTSASASTLLFLYEFKKDAEIKKTWPLLDIAQKYVADNYTAFFTQEIEAAIDSAKI